MSTDDIAEDRGREITALRAEVERLRAALGPHGVTLVNLAAKNLAAAIARAEAAEAEVERLGNIVAQQPTWVKNLGERLMSERDDAIARSETAESEVERLRAVAQAGLDWWENRRPLDWDESTHLANVAVNTVGPVERRLAVAVAQTVDRI